jgi:type IV secretory pathway TraG/TraD family ATPase VirD4
LAPVGELTHWLVGTTIDVALGLAIGVIAARLLRARHLHWSWAAGALVLVLSLRADLAQLGPVLAVAALSASMRSRRWHREDSEAGAALAALAARRWRPTDLLRAGANAIELHRRRTSGAEGWFLDQQLILGRDERGGLVSIPFGGAGGGTHTLLVGATGSGKTVTQSWMAVQAIERGMGAIVIDPKGDRDMRAAVARAARVGGRAFIEWTPEGPSVYNPFAAGSETEIADKLLAGERFTEPHYLRQAQRFLGHVVRALRCADREVSLRTVVEHLDATRLELLLRGLPEDEGRATQAYLDSLTPRQQADLAGVRDRLAILAESDIGRWLDPCCADRGRFDLLEAVQARAVVYFALDADSRPLLTQMLGAAIVQDLQTTVAALQGRPVPTVVVIDEFSALAAEHVVRLFGRARSAGMSLVLSSQELTDLRLPGRETLLDQLMGNLTVLLAHRQVVPESAELIGSLAGTRGAWRTSRHGDGRLTRTRTRERILDPNEVMRLGPGWTAAIVLSAGGGARIARVFAPKQQR